MNSARKIGILSGTFDPVHYGHIVVVEAAIGQLGLDEVWLIPERQSWRKTPSASYEDRKRMLELALADKKNLQLYESDREHHDINLLKDLKQDYPDVGFILIFGQDIAEGLENWPDIDWIRQQTKIAMAKRGDDEYTKPEVIDAIISIDSEFKSQAIRQGQQPEGLDPKVASYITEHNLYNSPLRRLADGGKPELRRELKAARQALSLEDAESKSRAVVKKLIEYLDWSKIKTVQCYTPVRTQREVDTWDLLEFIWIDLPEVKVYMPAVLPEPRTGRYMAERYDQVYEITKDTNLVPNSRGVPEPCTIRYMAEPERPEPEDAPQFDLIIIPMLGFDKTGYRLGFGGGYYDRFLKTQNSAIKVGLAWESALLDNLSHEDHDVSMDIIVTEKHVRRIKK